MGKSRQDKRNLNFDPAGRQSELPCHDGNDSSGDGVEEGLTGREFIGWELQQAVAGMLQPAGEIMDPRWVGVGGVEKHFKVTRSRTQRVLGAVKLFCRTLEWWTHVRPLSKLIEWRHLGGSVG